MVTGSEPDEDTTGSTKDPIPAQDAPSHGAPVGISEPSEAKAAPTSSPAQHVTMDEGKARSQAVEAVSHKRAEESAAAAKKRAALGSPTPEPPIAKGHRSLFDSESKNVEVEGDITETQEIYNDPDEQQERYQAAQLQGASEVSSSAPPTPMYPRGYYPPNAGSGSPMFLEHLKAPCGLNHGRISRGANGWITPHPISGRRPVLQMGFSKELHSSGVERTPRRSSAVLCLGPARSRIEFAHLIAKRQLHSVMEGLRQQSKSSAQDERRYGSVNPGTVHRKAAKKSRTTYAPAVVSDPRSRQPSGCQPGAGLPAPTSSVTRGNPATSQAAGAFQSAAALGLPVPHGSGALCSDQGGQEEPSHAFEYEAPSQPIPSGSSTSGRDSVGSLLSDEGRQLRDRVYAIKIALALGGGGQASTPAGKPESLEVL
ncbi:Hypothetical protein PHPALM_36181 [Phytophthora palmivora]|uniref:Uncharacterized protein n=1 Tax=Phytophthora palmivora TaxID=4796 RepID=A0A2P4X0N3_9STRA|nr:Hypothetical protein PHPALM_36181 [Phytophthora palmivora]